MYEIYQHGRQGIIFFNFLILKIWQFFFKNLGNLLKFKFMVEKTQLIQKLPNSFVKK